MRLFLDMDDVLCDFTGAACRAWGLTPEQAAFIELRDEWSMVSAVSRALGRPAGKPLAEPEFWQPIRGRADFWAGLEPLPWFADMIGLANELTDDWHVVTSPINCPGCYGGKAEWLRRHLGPGAEDRLVLTRNKSLLARPGSVLVDDRPDTVRDFVKAGGSAALIFPRGYNGMRAFASDPVKKVAQTLRYYARDPHFGKPSPKAITAG